eukprot:gnl/TRDRNA2_/TRDRNA2_59459_c0_seq1.p1 gnl/TRDRNA2_/TRDRNA2_59459_c0~~gnl/TRDRNA2_/TRDRNA2_59459_c0_seq1.p1  ORF type:complete len:434 (-),score=71.37 gnl/TRDRNA2_/TRDRNA2_59459_c0_seq1:172-1473(-)
MGLKWVFGVALLVGLVRAKPASFITLGDWGGAALGGYHEQDQKVVAKAMTKTAQDAGIKFVVNTGDNFYYCGIQNTSDYQIKMDFEDVYTDKSLMVPWYSILGNHEYGYNVDAQVEYKDPNGRWIMPSRYYTKRVQLADSHYLTIISLDSNPCVSAYRSSDPKGYDPCGSEFPTCAPVDEGKCEFHPNIMSQDCGKQFSWFKEQLASVSKDDWLIIVGHHEADEMDVEDFVGAMQDHGFDLYLNGHVHTLAQYTVNGKSNFVTSGAGCMVRTKDQDHEDEVKGLKGNNIFDKKVAGYTLHTFDADFKTLRTDFIDATDGSTIHTFTVTKGHTPPGPSPGPSPPGPSPTPGSCKGTQCKYVSGRACQCNIDCKDHNDCCSDYLDVCGTCVGSGCKYHVGSPCQCNKECKHYGDCCHDYDKVCDHMPEDEPLFSV